MTGLQFEVPEFEYRPKGMRWYFALSGVTITLLAFAWFSQNYLFGGLVIVAVATLAGMSLRRPQTATLVIDGEGVSIGKTKWQYKDLQGFSLRKNEENSDTTYLILISESKFLLPAKIIAPDPEAIRKELNNFLTEVEYKESVVEVIVRLLGLS